MVIQDNCNDECLTESSYNVLMLGNEGARLYSGEAHLLKFRRCRT